MIVGRVGRLWRYAVKSMEGESLEACSLGELGIPGDRGWAVRDETAGEIRNGRKLPQLLLCRARYPKEPAEGEIPPAEIELPKDPGVVRAIVRELDQNLGTYASVRTPGRVAVGDAVELV